MAKGKMVPGWVAVHKAFEKDTNKLLALRQHLCLSAVLEGKKFPWETAPENHKGEVMVSNAYSPAPTMKLVCRYPSSSIRRNMEDVELIWVPVWIDTSKENKFEGRYTYRVSAEGCVTTSASATNQALEYERKVHKDALDTQEKEIQRQQDIINKLRADLSVFADGMVQNQVLLKVNDTLRRERDAAQSELSKQAQKMNMLETSLNISENSAVKLRKEVDSLQARLHSLKKEVYAWVGSTFPGANVIYIDSLSDVMELLKTPEAKFRDEVTHHKRQ